MDNLETAEQSNGEKITTSITTWNGALSYENNDPLVEIFFKSVRDIPCEDYRSINVKQSKAEKARLNNSLTGSKTLEQYFDASWESDPLRTLKFIFYLRDCRGGKGERKLFRALIRHMRSKCPEHVIANMEHIPTYGSWKDISLCFLGTPLEIQAVKLIADQLRIDIESKTPSLCAKYSPSEGGSFDKAHHASKKIAASLGASPANYRKRYIAPLRAKLNIVEREMCARDWDHIKYESVPSIAGSRYKKAFNKHDEQRYTEYLQSVKRGEKKMNVGVLMPYQIVAPYLKCTTKSVLKDETSEAQWVAFLADRASKWPRGLNVVPLIDVSGSMFNHRDPQAVEAAVSLGMTFSLLNSSQQYKGKFITFHDHPQLLSITGDSLMDQVNSIKTTPWGGSTNIQSAFDLILNIATTFNVPHNEMPQILLILSDMQFNQADGCTNWDLVESKYSKAGYTRPTIIFWNLNGNSVDYPVPNSTVPRCALLSGFNDAIMYSLLDGTLPNPKDIVHKALDKERYDVIHLA